jgi:hypothetical protein
VEIYSAFQRIQLLASRTAELSEEPDTRSRALLQAIAQLRMAAPQPLPMRPRESVDVVSSTRELRLTGVRPQ